MSTCCLSGHAAGSVVKMRKGVEAVVYVEKKVSRLVSPGPVREAIMVPWRLDSAGRPPNVEVMAEVEAALGTMLGAATLQLPGVVPWDLHPRIRSHFRKLRVAHASEILTNHISELRER